MTGLTALGATVVVAAFFVGLAWTWWSIREEAEK